MSASDLERAGAFYNSGSDSDDSNNIDDDFEDSDRNNINSDDSDDRDSNSTDADFEENSDARPTAIAEPTKTAEPPTKTATTTTSTYNTPPDDDSRMDDPSEAYGPNRQREVYASGMLADQRPEMPVSPDELEEAAMAALSAEARAYVAGSAGGEDTADRNREAFRRW